MLHTIIIITIIIMMIIIIIIIIVRKMFVQSVTQATQKKAQVLLTGVSFSSVVISLPDVAGGRRLAQW